MSKNSGRVAKRALKGSKIRKSIYLSNYDSIRPKNWQMLRTNWYNYLRKSFKGYRVYKNWLFGAKGAKIYTSRVAKRALKGPKIRKSDIPQQLLLYKARKLANVGNQLVQLL